LLRHSPDPRVRSYLVHRLSPLGADARSLVKRLAEEPDVSARRALLLCLGEFGTEQLPPAERDALVPTLLRLYPDDPDPGPPPTPGGRGGRSGCGGSGNGATACATSITGWRRGTGRWRAGGVSPLMSAAGTSTARARRSS